MIEKNEIEYLAKLSRIALSPEEIELHQEKLENFFEYVKEIQSIDTSDTLPLSHPIPDEQIVEDDMANVFREDVVDEQKILDREEVLSQAPKQKDGMFEVPPIL